MGGLEEAGLALTRVGERAALVAEELRLDQASRNRRAVDLDQGLVSSHARSMHEMDQQPLADARLPENEEGRQSTTGGGRAGKEPLDLRSQRQHRRAVPDQPLQAAHQEDDVSQRLATGQMTFDGPSTASRPLSDSAPGRAAPGNSPPDRVRRLARPLRWARARGGAHDRRLASHRAAGPRSAPGDPRRGHRVPHLRPVAAPAHEHAPPSARHRARGLPARVRLQRAPLPHVPPAPAPVLRARRAVQSGGPDPAAPGRARSRAAPARRAPGARLGRGAHALRVASRREGRPGRDAAAARGGP